MSLLLLKMESVDDRFIPLSIKGMKKLDVAT